MLLGSDHNTAILFFANSPELEQGFKPIAKSDRLFNSLELNALKKIRNTGLPYYRSNEQNQVGATFGQRFIVALRSVFDKGYDNLIVIGNDTPQLSQAHLIETVNLLQEGKTVIGPSTDGGFYLLGLTKARFNESRFLELPWQRANLFQSIYQLLLTQGTVYKFPMFSDIDSISDIDAVLSTRKAISYSLRNLLKQLMGPSFVPTLIRVQAIATGFYLSLRNKGSPLQVV